MDEINNKLKKKDKEYVEEDNVLKTINDKKDGTGNVKKTLEETISDIDGEGNQNYAAVLGCSVTGC